MRWRAPYLMLGVLPLATGCTSGDDATPGVTTDPPSAATTPPVEVPDGLLIRLPEHEGVDRGNVGALVVEGDCVYVDLTGDAGPTVELRRVLAWPPGTYRDGGDVVVVNLRIEPGDRFEFGGGDNLLRSTRRFLLPESVEAYPMDCIEPESYEVILTTSAAEFRLLD